MREVGGLDTRVESWQTTNVFLDVCIQNHVKGTFLGSRTIHQISEGSKSSTLDTLYNKNLSCNLLCNKM